MSGSHLFFFNRALTKSKSSSAFGYCTEYTEQKLLVPATYLRKTIDSFMEVEEQKVA